MKRIILRIGNEKDRTDFELYFFFKTKADLRLFSPEDKLPLYLLLDSELKEIKKLNVKPLFQRYRMLNNFQEFYAWHTECCAEKDRQEKQIEKVVIYIDSLGSKYSLESYIYRQTHRIYSVGNPGKFKKSMILKINEDFTDPEQISKIEAFRYEGRKFPTVNHFIRWHKDNHRICCGFDYSKSPEEAFRNCGFEHVRNYGSANSKRIAIHTCDSGERRLYRCKNCGCYILVQESEMWITEDWYEDYIPVYSEKHAEFLNERFGGSEIENNYPYTMLFKTDGRNYSWH